MAVNEGRVLALTDALMQIILLIGNTADSERDRLYETLKSFAMITEMLLTDCSKNEVKHAMGFFEGARENARETVTRVKATIPKEGEKLH